MDDMGSGGGWVLLGVLVAGAIAAAGLYGKLRSVIRRFERRVEELGLALAAAGAEMAGARQEIAALRQEAASRADAATSNLPVTPAEWAAMPQEMAALARRAEAVEAALARVSSTTRIANILASPVVREHLAALREDRVAAPRISYPFQAAMRALSPRITRRPGKTVLCTVALGEAYQERVAPALASHQAYAARHGLSHAILSDPPSYRDRPPAWTKIPLVMLLLEQGYDRVAYIDADALITNPDFDLGTVFGTAPGHGRVTLTEDEAGINCGVMFFEDGPAIRRVLDLVWLFDADVTNGTWEQFALKALMALSHDVTRCVAIVEDPRRFNAFPDERNRFYRTMARSVWQPGDFLCHFSGIRTPHLEALIRDYAAATAWAPAQARPTEAG